MINVQYISVESITELVRLIENKLGENLHQLPDSKKLNICQNVRYLMTIWCSRVASILPDTWVQSLMEFGVNTL